MKKSFFLATLLAVALTMSAAVVEPQRALQVAREFVPQQHPAMHGQHAPAAQAGTIVYTHYMPQSGKPAIYVVNIGNAFAIVSADDVAHPILGYNHSKAWPTDGNLPPQVKSFFDDLAQQMEAAAEHPQDAATAAEWQNPRKAPKRAKMDNLPDSVGPLLTTTWDQGQYYNALCPADGQGPDGHVYTGCVATAMAQIINYWGQRETIHTRGTHSYDSNYGTLEVNYDTTTYDFAHMPDVLTSTSTPQEVNAVAKLMYHCGVAVNMVYRASSSGAYIEDARTALISFWGFTPTLGHANRALYTDQEWEDSIRSNIDRGEPIFYSGSNSLNSHAFVIDGYKQDGYFHFNFGWEGNADGWYLTKSTSSNFGYNEGRAAIMGIRPDNNSHAIICHRTMYVQNMDWFVVSNPIDIYPLRGKSDYKAVNALIGTRTNLTLVPQDSTEQLVLDVLQFEDYQSVVIYDGVDKEIPVRVLETREYIYSFLYEGNDNDTILHQMAGRDFSPIVSTRHGFTIIAYSYGGIPESFHLRVSNASDCRMVSNLTLTEDANGVHVSWQEEGNATHWQVNVGDTIFDCDSTHLYITEIAHGTPYNVRVRTVCGENIYSSWNTGVVNRRVYWKDVVKAEPEGYVLDGDTIHITSAEGLAWLAIIFNNAYITGSEEDMKIELKVLSIENDINLNGYLWTPIRHWCGNIEGNGHVISNLLVSTYGYGGLFTEISGKIRDIGLDGSRINATSGAGALTGISWKAQIINCWSINHIISSGNSQSGGLVGGANNSQIMNCFAYGRLSAQVAIGGVVGGCANTEMTNCVSSVTEKFSKGGFLAGEVHGGTFTNCFSDVSRVKRTWTSTSDESESLAKRIYFFGDVYNVDVIENIAAFNISLDTIGSLITDTAINYTLGENIDVVSALNNKVADYNSSEYRMWARDSITHLPVLSGHYEVTCPKVSNINAENIPYKQGFAVALAWQENGEAIEWQIKCNIRGASEDSSIIFNAKTTYDTICGLSLGNEYSFYVRPICGNVDTIGWGQPYNFYVDKTLWVDMVTTCPEGYISDEMGNVIVSSEEGLAWVAKLGYNWSSSIITIVSDLDMGAYKWTPIGGIEFNGSIIGNNHVISNLYYNDSEGQNIGLVGKAIGATFKDIVLKNNKFIGKSYVGSVVGSATNCTIDNCHSIDILLKGQDEVGGIAGLILQSMTYNCSSSGVIYSDIDEGGLGGTVNGIVKNCYSNCDIRPLGKNTRSNYGGIIGTAIGNVDNCYSVGRIDRNNRSYRGGLLFGRTVDLIGSYIYANPQEQLSFGGTEEGATAISNSSLVLEGELLTAVTVEEILYTDLLSALNAWVDANNSEGKYRHWVADTENINGGFPIFDPNDSPSTGIGNINVNTNAVKIFHDGQIFIIRGEKVYTLQGQEVK